MLRNYIDTNIDLTKVIRTQISLKSVEFDSYVIGTETTITFTLKEFKALLAFAEALSLPLQLQFETTGRPAVFIVHNGTTFEAHFVLATSKPDNATQATSTQNTIKAERKRKDNSTEGSARKRLHVEPDADISKCLDEDSHLFNFIDIPEETEPVQVNGLTDKQNGNVVSRIEEIMDCDIPASPTSKIFIKSVFKKCFEATFDPRNIIDTVLADDSDTE